MDILVKRFRTFRSLKVGQKSLFLEAVFFQYLTWILLFFVPFRRVIPQRSGNPKGGIPLRGSLLAQIKEATARANTLAIWKNRCLVQALATRKMLTRRGIGSTLHLGFAASTGKKYLAHAWLQVGEFEVVNKGNVEVVLFEKS